MPKSKNRKQHKSKVVARNQRILSEKNKMSKIQDYFQQQMMKEIEEGKFNDENVIKLPSENENENDDSGV